MIFFLLSLWIGVQQTDSGVHRVSSHGGSVRVGICSGSNTSGLNKSVPIYDRINKDLFILTNHQKNRKKIKCTSLIQQINSYVLRQYTALYCTVLRQYTALYCTVLHYKALYCTIPHCTALYCTIKHYTVLHCTIRHYTALYCTILHYKALYCTIPHYTAL